VFLFNLTESIRFSLITGTGLPASPEVTGWPDPDFINQKPQADVSDIITGNYIYEKVHQILARGPRTLLLIYLKNHNMW